MIKNAVYFGRAVLNGSTIFIIGYFCTCSMMSIMIQDPFKIRITCPVLPGAGIFVILLRVAISHRVADVVLVDHLAAVSTAEVVGRRGLAYHQMRNQLN